MKIAHLWYAAPLFGGAERWAIGFCKAMKKMNVQSEIVCWKSESLIKQERVFRVLHGTVSSNPDIIEILMNGAFMARHLKSYDIVCPHHADMMFPAVFSKTLSGNQVACFLHNPPLGWQLSEEGISSYRHISESKKSFYRLWKKFLPYSDFFFTNSTWNKKLYEKYEEVSPTPLLAGVDKEIFRPDEDLRDEYRRKLNIDDDTTLLFYSSAAGRRKRHEILIRGVRVLIDKGYKVKCVLTCSRDRKTNTLHPLVRRIIEELQLETDILTFPATSEKVLVGLFNACDIYVHPANNEHLGMAILEALAVGKPVVAQNNGGVPDLITNGSEGLLFKTDNTLSMVNEIERLILDEKLCKAMGERALKRSKAFDWQEVAQKFLQIVS